MAGFSVRPLVPGRPGIVMPGLAKNLFGLLKPDGRDDHVQRQGVLEYICFFEPDLMNVFYFVIMGTPWSKQLSGCVSQKKNSRKWYTNNPL